MKGYKPGEAGAASPRTRAVGHARDAGASSYGARSLDVVDFVGARVSELRALRKAAAAISGNRRVYQQLAWHDRRRTMSHTSHRMPARLRQAHRRELALSAPASQTVDPKDGSLVEKKHGPQGKMRCRKYRRRAPFLSALRKLRGKNPLWLETHIWHAKRFHMQTIEGNCTVALFPNDRGLRSGYRAVSHACLAHDSSYLDVIELTSEDRGIIISVMSRCFGPEDCAMATTDPVVAGLRRVERLVVLEANGYAIGPVDILWRPSAECPQVWLWSHPAASSAICCALQAACVNDDVRVTILSNQLLTFSLLGPRAGSVLGAVFYHVRGGGVEWECIKGIRSAASLPPGAVLALEVEDPRASFPPKRTQEGGRLAAGKDVSEALAGSFANVADSGIWSAAIRGEKTGRAKRKDKTPYEYIPVLCVQRTNGLSRGFGAGWDIVLPSGWGMPFWVSLLYANGGRAAGQRELRFFALESALPIFPEDYQDTIPGRTAMATQEAERRASHERRPKSKRVDFDKYRISSPFSADLPSLFAQNPGKPTPSRVVVSTEAEPKTSPDFNEKQAPGDKPRVRILRSKSVVRAALAIGTYATDKSPQLQHSREDRSKKGSTRRIDGPSPPKARWMPIKPLSFRKDESTSSRVEIETVYDYCLFQGTLRPCSKGTPLQNAIICAPNPEDIDHWKKSCREYAGPVEALARKSDVRSGIVCASRKVIGRVVSGDYSLVRGCGVGRCVITVPAVLELLRTGACPSWQKGTTRVDRTTRREEFVQIQVLFRNIRSLQYRPAIATIRI